MGARLHDVACGAVARLAREKPGAIFAGGCVVEDGSSGARCELRGVAKGAHETAPFVRGRSRKVSAVQEVVTAFSG